MRSTIIGIIIGIVFGIMAGASVVNPGLQQAALKPAENPAAISQQHPTSPPALAQGSTSAKNSLNIINLFMPQTSLSKDITAHVSEGFLAKFYAPNALVPEGDSVQAVKSGAVDALFGAPDIWDQNSATLQLFSGIPFGPDAQEFLAWFYQGGGQALFERQFSRQRAHGILCAILPASGSSWFRFPVRNIDNLKDISLQSFGLGARVWTKMGAHVQTLKAKEALVAFKNGRLDAAHFGLPSVDGELGFGHSARNYYFPSWQQPTTPLALIINAKVWKNLPARTQRSITQTCGDTVRYALSTSDAVQFEALKKLGLSGVQVRRWPKSIFTELKAKWKQVARELVQKDPDFNTAWSSLHLFRRDYTIWRELSQP
ncbi:MAG: C4-dicarboxylate ABC transporter [Magnetovibrio sp.]|nr:C4-dicarboxylate ABC transporter [Magnetovibrio sp.]